MSCRVTNKRQLRIPLVAIVLALAMIVVQPPGLNWPGFIAWAQGVCGIAALGDSPGEDGFQIDGQFYSGPDADDWAQGGSYGGVILDDGTPNPLYFPSLHDRDAHCAGGAKDPTIFAESNKNNDPIQAAGTDSVWHFAEGDTPPKNDLTDVYAHSRTFDVGGETEVWLMLAAMTRAANGASHVDFEWNIAGLEMITYPTLANDGEIYGHGPDLGRTADIDFIISVDFEVGGTTPLVTFRRWTEIEPGAFEYIEFDPGAGNVFVCTDVTGAEVPPWGAVDPSGDLIFPPATATPLQFVEMGVDLTALGIDPFDLCSSTSTLLFKTRSSASFTAELKDFALYPFPLVVVPGCSLDDPIDVCEDEFPGGGITINSTVTPEGGSFSYEWYLDDVLQLETGPFFTLPPQTPGTYDICLIVEDTETGCKGDACCTTVTVHEAPQCMLSDPGDFCQDDFVEAVITNTPSGGTGPYTYEWWVNGSLQGETGNSLTVTDNSVGSYLVESRVTDAYDCDGELCSVTYEVFEDPTCMLSDPGDFCQDDFVEAVITNTPTGGTGPYAYEWWVDGVLQAETGAALTVTGNAVGTYLIESRVTDSNDCDSDLCDVSYEIFENPACSLSDPGDFCQGDFVSATVTNTPSGGTGPYTYEWWVNGYVSTETGATLTITVDGVDTYLVESRVTDSNGCASDICDVSYEIFENPACSLSDPGDSCQDDFVEAVITNTPSGGTGPYTYEWWVNAVLQTETGATLTVTDNAIGIYLIESRVTDSNDCESDICDVSYEITEQPTCSLDDPGDFCQDDFTSATITSTPSGGAGGYTYEWWVNGALQTETGSSLTVTDNAIGIYLIESRVTDVNGCASDLCDVSYEIFENPACSLSDPGDFCHDDFVSSTVTNTPSGGTPPFSYEWWVDGTPQAETGATLSVTAGGVGLHLVESRVTDSEDCESDVCFVEYEIYENPSCMLSDPGDFCQDVFVEAVITNTPSGGTGPFTFEWWVNAVLQSETGSSLTVTDSSIGSYLIESRVTDSQDCESDICDVTYEIFENPSCDLSDPGDFCQDDFVSASITNTPSGGTAPYTYAWWVNGVSQAETGATLTVTDNTVGVYLIESRVADAYCGSDICDVSYEIFENPACSLSDPGDFCQDQFVSATVTNTPSGGTPPFTYEWWVNGSPQTETGSSLTVTDSSIGSYLIESRITDSNDCESDICDVTYEIVENPDCDLSDPGDFCQDVFVSATITNTPSGGTPPFTYEWWVNGSLQGETSATLTVTENSISVYLIESRATDAEDCVSVICDVSYEIYENPACSLSDPGDFCQDVFVSATITNTPSGGTAPFMYEWWVNAALQAEMGATLTVTDNSIGVYLIESRVTDSQDCESDICDVTYEIYENPACSLSDPGDVCQDVFVEAVITNTPTGGTAPFTYEWWVNAALQAETGATLTVTDSSIGIYLIESRVTDSQDCESDVCDVTYEIYENPACSLSDPGDFCQDVFVEAVITNTPSGGTAPFTYEWWVNAVLQAETGATLTVTDSSIGVYLIESRVTDSQDCESDVCDVTYEIYENPTCLLSDPGDFCQDVFVEAVITNTPTGGTAPFTYEWWVNAVLQAETGATLTVTDSSVGIYLIESRVTDSQDCESDICDVSYEIYDNPACSLSDPGDFCQDQFVSAIITNTPSGGTAPFTYEWWVNAVLQAETGAILTVTDNSLGIYLIESRVTDSQDCESDICDVSYEIFENPPCEIEGPDNACEYDLPDTLCGPVAPPDKSYSYIWTGPTGPTRPVGKKGVLDGVADRWPNEQCIAVNETGRYWLTVVDDSTGCASADCYHDFEVIPIPVCEILAPDPLPPCGTEGHELCATEDNPDYTYSWELITAPAGWELVPPTNEYCVTYNTGDMGEATFELTVTDQYGCVGTCEVTFECEPADEFCSFTQGFYGNAGGAWNGMGTLEIIQGLITPTDPLIVGVWGTRAVKFEDGSEQCIIARLPGGGPDVALPDFGSQVLAGPPTCQTDPALPTQNGRFRNNLLAQTIALSLNVRLGDDGDLATLGLCRVMKTQAALCGDDGICGTSDDIPDPGPDGMPGTGDEDIMTVYIPESVLEALDTLGLGRTVGGLLELANRGLAGMDTDVAGLSQIQSGVDAINNAFDECRFIIGCTDMPHKEGIITEFGGGDGLLKDVPLAFALSANAPNPVREGTSIRFALPEASQVKISVYNLRGQVVSVIEDGVSPAGYHTVHWHSGGHARAAGVYFYRMEAIGMESGKTFSHTQKMVVVR